MIDTIVFDMGQVLIRWQPEIMLQQYHLTDDEMKLLNTELFKSVEWVQQDRGIISEEAVASQVCARLPEKLHEPVKTLVYSWHKRHLVPMPGMEELLRELKGKGYRIYLLSNASLALREYFPRIPGSDCFDGLMVSAEEKLLKPQHEIYEALYERFSINPSTSLFIDDAPANIEGSILTGMDGIIFRGDVPRLRRELHKKGICVHCEDTVSENLIYAYN